MTRRTFLNILLVINLFAISFFTQINCASAAGASLYLSPSTGTHVINSTFKVSVLVNSGGAPINAAEGSLSYDADLLDAVSVSKGSIFMFWTTEPSVGGGSVKFGGGNPSAYTGTNGHVVTVTFKAKKVGKAQVYFSTGAVLANDGKGTNILASMGSGSYTIAPKSEAPVTTPTKPSTDKPAPVIESVYNLPDIKSSTHPDSDKWYKESNIKFSWDLPSSVTGVSVLFDQEPISDPGPVADGKFSEKEITAETGGIWYLHLKFKDNKKWGTINHFRVMIDNKAPNPFKIGIENIEIGDWPIISFETIDEESGLLKYEIYVGNLEDQAHELEPSINEMQLKDLGAGTHTVLVKALDKAGNQRVETLEFVIDPIPTPEILDYPKEVTPDDKFYISGTAIENAQIIIIIESKSYTASSSVVSDANGNWLYIHDDKLDNGRFTSYVFAKNKKGMSSGDSAKISFVVSPPVFTEVGTFIIDYFTVIVSLIFMIILIVLIIFFFVMFVRRKLKKETIEIEEVLKRNLDTFEKEIDDEFEAIIKKERTATGKQAKTDIRDNLKKKLDKAGEDIMKEIQDVEDILK